MMRKIMRYETQYQARAQVLLYFRYGYTEVAKRHVVPGLDSIPGADYQYLT